MTNSIKITVTANPDLDDCLQGAADAYVADHPELAGRDLSPEWADNNTRETVTLTVPVDSVDGYHEGRLARAAAHISAVELSDGRWAHYADETSTWHVVDADDLEELCDYLDDDDQQVSGDAYSHWCAGTTSQEMPKGWEPGDDYELGPRTAHCSECGEQVDEYCEAHPAATVETIHTTTAADGTSHDDHERVRIVIGNRPTESIGSAAQLVELIDRAVSSGRLPDDDRDAAYRACCEHLGVDA